MKRALAFLAAAGALAGCAAEDPLEVDEAGAARAAASPPDLVAVAQAMDAQAGTPLSENLTILGAEASGRQLAMRFEDRRAAAEFGPAAREIYAMNADSEIREPMCAQPATRRFVEEHDGVAASIVSSDGEPLADVTIEEC